MGKKRVVHFGSIKAHVVQGFSFNRHFMKMSLYLVGIHTRTKLRKYSSKEQTKDNNVLPKLKVRYTYLLSLVIFKDKKVPRFDI